MLTFVRVPGRAAVGRGDSCQTVGPAEGAGAGGQSGAGVGRGGADARRREGWGGGGRGPVALAEESDGGTVSRMLQKDEKECKLTTGV